MQEGRCARTIDNVPRGSSAVPVQEGYVDARVFYARDQHWNRYSDLSGDSQQANRSQPDRLHPLDPVVRHEQRSRYTVRQFFFVIKQIDPAVLLDQPDGLGVPEQNVRQLMRQDKAPSRLSCHIAQVDHWPAWLTYNAKLRKLD
jgi:hypothetical protein